MKKKSIAFLILSVLAVIALNYIAFNGIEMFGKTYFTSVLQKGGIKMGIDLAGGSTITFEAEKENVTQEEMTAVETVIRTRLKNEGYTEARVSRNQSDPRKIRVEIPDIFDTQQAVDLLKATAKLTFTDSEGNVVLDGSDIKTANYRYGPVTQAGNSEHYIELELNESGVPKFAQATKEAAAKADTNENYISINMDDNPISSPRVYEEINDSKCIISGSFTQESASMLANQIKSGQLPVPLTVAEQSTIGPELGDKTFNTSMLASLFGIIAIMIFMLVFYRLSGLVADIALGAYIAVMALIIGIFKINLSLSGIAGIVLSIGMAVDANVIIFERIKEELRSGKTVRASVDAGFHRAMTAIIDANITTIIASVVLWLSRVATVQGFAITLFIGVLLSMITAITFTRFLLKQVVGLDVKNPKLYGA